MQVAYECVSLAFHPFGVALAAGSTDGHLIILNTETGATVVTIRVCGSPLNCVSYNSCKLIFTNLQTANNFSLFKCSPGVPNLFFLLCLRAYSIIEYLSGVGHHLFLQSKFLHNTLFET